MIIKLVDVFFSDTGLKNFAHVLKRFKLPHGASKIPNTAKRVKTLKMSEVTLTVSMLPFILYRMEGQIFKPSIIKRMNKGRAADDQLDTHKLKMLLIDTFLAMAKANKLLFAREIQCDYKEPGDPYLEQERLIILARQKIFELLQPIEAYAKKEAELIQKQQDESNKAFFAAAKLQEQQKDGQLHEAEVSEVDSDSDGDSDDEYTGDASKATGGEEEHDEEEDIQNNATNSRSAKRGSKRKPKKKSKNKKGKGKANPQVKVKGIRKVRIPNSLSSLPNFHNAVHEAPTSRQNGSSLNVSTSMGELQHRIFKLLVAHSNFYDLDLVFMRFANNMFTIRTLIDGGADRDGNYPHPLD